MDLAGLAWRDAILFVAAILVVYLVFMFLRLTQVGRRKPTAPISTATDDSDDEADWLPPQIGPTPSGPTTTPPAFDVHLMRSAMETEIQALKAETTRLTGELAQLRNEMELLKASHNVSPQYSEAMTLAQKGLDAWAIANRCGISIGEAELVAALARNVNLNEDDHVGITDPTNPRRHV